ncbi:hydrophobic/amphiphilic exporter-1, HAE1 family [Paraglaciecola polaris LMG 21857]|uniref:Hydrophobic/amphiphilic exporter-1, HAE1 family n=2 Tax=Paraglaciecola polaris TaxID=222814 RepID=K6ZV62_9ALTE|nr:hydrophobic/amphiphilic exporter-1, HAE1 family [Paraglaciecola polaris LMG 21857]|tara:strand:- start:20377 stop:23517 length:3141 start_codon:yes stop_codon:yes gene_type:complete
MNNKHTDKQDDKTKTSNTISSEQSQFSAGGAKLAAFAMRRPVTIGMLFFSMLLFGILASQLLPLEKFPSIDIPEIAIRIPYENATPAEIEKMITRPVEEVLATMSGIKRLRSKSTEDAAEIQLQFAWDENLKAKGIEAREKIDAIRNDLPTDVERILVYQFNTSDLPIFQLRVSSDRDLSDAYDLLERNLKMPIERVPGVSKVELYGVLKKQIAIRIDTQKQASLGISNSELLSALRQANFAMTAGSFYDLGKKITINPQGEFSQIEDIEALLLKKGVQLSDIASIGYESPKRIEGRHLDRTYAVGFNIFRESNSNLVAVSDAVMKVINQADDSPTFAGITLFVMDDEASSVTESLSDLLNAGMLGALLSVCVLYVFLRNITTTLIVVLSVPFSICITLGCMYFMGYTINILSMMGLMLAVGMLVDNAVVVTESIQQERNHYHSAVEATKAGVGKVSLAVIAGTTTTAIVFLPNIIGVKVNLTIFLEHVAIAICISLFASLLIAQTLIPLLASKVAHPPKPKNQPQASHGRLANVYRKTLIWSLSHRGLTCLVALLILISTAIPMQFVSGDDDDDNNNRLWLNYDIQGNYSLAEVEKSVDKMEAYLYANQDAFHVEQVYTYYTAGEATSALTLRDDLPVAKSELKARIMKDMPSFARARPTFKWEEGNGGGLQLTLLGESSESLSRVAQRVLPAIEKIEGLTDVGIDGNNQKFELQITVDRNKAFRYGLSANDVARTIASGLRGTNLRTFRDNESGEIGVRMLFDEALQESISELKNLTITRIGQQTVTLDMLSSTKIVPRLAEIRRSYRQTSLTIGANMRDDVTLQQAKERIENVMQYLTLPDGYSWTFDGSIDRQNQNEAVMQTNMLLAICMIYIVMAALFESLLLPTAVITSLLFSLTGVFWALFVTATPMSVMSMIGMLILMGIVVNNGIVLVDRINQLINQDIALNNAVIEACLTRVKPILMTVATTIVGLIPLALGDSSIGGDGPAYSPMAIAIIGGLAFSTVTSLVLVPLAYVLLLRLRCKASALMGLSKQWANKIIQA